MIVVMGKYGRLGNQLWTHANVFAFCMEHGIPYCSPAFPERHSFRFASRAPGFPQRGYLESNRMRSLLVRGMYKTALRLPSWPIIHIGERSRLDLDRCAEQLVSIAASRTTFLTGLYFSAPASMRKNRTSLLESFAPIDELQTRVDRLLARTAGRPGPLIGVHMRRGDYRTYCDGIMYYSAAEYADVMRSLANSSRHRGGARFLVCTDEPVEPGSFDGLDVTVSTESPIVDLYSLAACDMIVGPNSSFSQWASYYGDVPLHVLNYKAAETHGSEEPVRHPDPEKHFSVFSPESFVRYSRQSLELPEALAAPRR
ncbi:alpha-1,2-fucosyltransferase [Arenimonas sp.]|uniref:alpha-1,2-fucosyltransferase n=1 Tax=Arenimonas sp. TaxID=1872635 RepID=UPI0039E282F8